MDGTDADDGIKCKVPVPRKLVCWRLLDRMAGHPRQHRRRRRCWNSHLRRNLLHADRIGIPPTARRRAPIRHRHGCGTRSPAEQYPCGIPTARDDGNHWRHAGNHRCHMDAADDIHRDVAPIPHQHQALIRQRVAELDRHRRRDRQLLPTHHRTHRWRALRHQDDVQYHWLTRLAQPELPPDVAERPRRIRAAADKLPRDYLYIDGRCNRPDLGRADSIDGQRIEVPVPRKARIHCRMVN